MKPCAYGNCEAAALTYPSRTSSAVSLEFPQPTTGMAPAATPAPSKTRLMLAATESPSAMIAGGRCDDIVRHLGNDAGRIGAALDHVISDAERIEHAGDALGLQLLVAGPRHLHRKKDLVALFHHLVVDEILGPDDARLVEVGSDISLPSGCGVVGIEEDDGDTGGLGGLHFPGPKARLRGRRRDAVRLGGDGGVERFLLRGHAGSFGALRRRGARHPSFASERRTTYGGGAARGRIQRRERGRDARGGRRGA